MQGKETMLYQYMEGSSKRFIIPVYQRNYDWKIEQCKRLYDDLVKLIKQDRKTHFFGSLVSTSERNLDRDEYYIIDGQQRLTTISLFLLALHNLIEEGQIESKDKRLPEKIKNEFLVDKYEEDKTRIKLKPIKNDAQAFHALVDGEETMKDSNLTINYNYFRKRILRGEISPDQLYQAFTRLQIIDIYLTEDDNPQLIFESLNSTGLDLSEGDKIRNYILMDVKPVKLQEKYYKDYWHKIEKATNYQVSDFVRDYLSIKMQSTPAMKKVYLKFKDFMDKKPFHEEGEDILLSREKLMQDLLSYAKRYEILIKANSPNRELNSIIERLNILEATVTRPFLMEVLKYAEEGQDPAEQIDQDQLVEIFRLVESYIFRRRMCDIPTNSLNKIFVSLNREILSYDGSRKDYLEKFKYSLANKKANAIYPNDPMFKEGISNKQVYRMTARNKKYIMERLENWGTKEVKDVWQLIEEGSYSIEHIMPQKLTKEWKEDLGPNYLSIHEEWIDKLANLTLTAYNSNYSNRRFTEKRDMPNGFSDSGIRMNQRIAKYDKWTSQELEDRNEKLIARAIKIWPSISSNYQPEEKPMESVSLADDTNLRGRKIIKISFLGEDIDVASWTEAYTEVLTRLHVDEPSILLKLAEDQSKQGLARYLSKEDYQGYKKLDEDLYLAVNYSTDSKINILRQFFEIYQIEEDELIFYLYNAIDKNTNSYSPINRQEFWSQALTTIRKERGRFLQVSPSSDNWISSSLGYPGMALQLIANLKDLRVEIALQYKEKEVNKSIFNFIAQDKEEIEVSLGKKLEWKNDDKQLKSSISLVNREYGIEKKEQWPAAIDFLNESVQDMELEIINRLDKYFQNK